MAIDKGTSRLRFSVLGPLRVERDGVEVDVGGPKQRLLLGALLLSANRTVSVDRLIDLLWGESATERAQPTLHVYVAKLRKALGDGGDTPRLIDTVRPGYRLNLVVEQLDLLEFHELAAAARESVERLDFEAASKAFGKARHLPRGRMLADLADEDFVAEEVQAFERTQLAVTTDALDCELRRGRHGEVLGDLQRLVSQNPLDERLCGLLMLALYRSGQQVEALATFKRLRSTLAEELGIEPNPEIQDLELKVLNHDPVLATAMGQRAIGDLPPTVTRSSRISGGGYLEMEGERFELTRVVTTIGRMPDRSVVLSDPDASRHHAEIRRDAEGFVLVDVGSTNGTSVNGRRVSSHVLQSGDLIEIGDAKIAFHSSRQ